MSENMDKNIIGDEDLEQVSGGKGSSAKHIIKTANMQPMVCPHCLKTIYVDMNKNEVICRACKKTIELKG